MVIEAAIGLAANAATKIAIEKTASSLTEKLSSNFAKNKYDELRIKFNKGLPAYLKANYAKCETIKTLLNRNSPIPLEKCFVAPNFKMSDKMLQADELLDQINSKSMKVIITGLAGSGKSVFLKYAFKKVIEKGHTYYPFFFELRLLNRMTSKKGMLLNAIFESVKECCHEFTRIQFNYGLKTGAFSFLLDGFDEVSHELRERISEEINMISRSHSKCAVMVSSRPSDEFVSWEGFTEANLLPFNLEQAIEYIEKLDFDQDKKSEFVEDLKRELFAKNKEFLSNPLLAAMMLLTYDSFGEIPEKRHIFYSKCFDVLAREHDASKGRYKRELYSTLSMDQLEKTFMFFCAFTYVNRTFSFSEVQMGQFVTEAVEACGYEADINNVIRDFRESISIMELDGMNYEFAHRSFQEYFYAKFVVADRKLSFSEKIDWMVRDFGSDDTVEMIADMDRATFEDEYLLPKTIALDAKIFTIDSKKNPTAILSKFFSRAHSSTLTKVERENNLINVYYTSKNPLNIFIYQQAARQFQDEFLPDKKQEPGHMQQPEGILLKEKFGGEVKIHHANNEKIVEIGGDGLAEIIKTAIGKMREHLQKLQLKRKQGLGAIMKKRYSNKR